jgi:hypothetical protein
MTGTGKFKSPSLRHTAFTCKGFSAECLGNVNLVLALVVAADLRIGWGFKRPAVIAVLGFITVAVDLRIGWGLKRSTVLRVTKRDRTRNVTEFEEAIEKADAGEMVYLTVVRSGRREQIRVALPVQ